MLCTYLYFFVFFFCFFFLLFFFLFFFFFQAEDGIRDDLVTGVQTCALPISNMPGVYRCDFPDAAWATGVDQVVCSLVAASANNAAIAPILIDIADVDLRDAVRAGMTALPNAAADATGGLPISDAGGLDLDAKLANTNEITVARMGALTDWINGGRLDLIIDLINAATTGLAGAAMRGTDGANTVVPDVAGFLPTALEVADAVWDEILTGATHNIATSAGRRLRGIQDFQGYENGAIWVDTVNGSAGTTDYENGTVENAVDTWADALTLNASLGFNKFVLKNASAITLSANSDGYHIIGAGPTTLAFNGQSVVGITVENCVVSGVMVGAGTTQRLLNCAVGAVTLIKGTHAHTSAIVGDQTVGEAGDYFYDRCHSGIAGTDTWSFNFGAAIGNTNLNWRNGSGGIQIESMGATGTDTASIEGRGQIIEGTCTGGTVAVRGLFETSGITNLTLVDGARFQSDDLVNDFWSDTLTTYTDGMAGKRLKSITAVPVDEGTVNDAGATTTTVITTLTGREDGHYDDALFVLEIAADQWQGRPVLSYNGTTGTFTFEEGFTSAPVNGSAIAVQSHHIHPVSQIADGILDRDMSTGTDSGSATVRTIRQALRPNRNKVSISGGVLTVYKEDDSTASHTAAVTTAAGDPIDSIDPAG